MTFDDIKPGYQVTISERGKQRTGRAVMFNSKADCWVLNAGGAHGTPILAFRNNVIKIKRGKKRAS